MEYGSIEWGSWINRGFMLILGVVLWCSFTLVRNNIYMYILSTIGFGFHLAFLNYIYFKVEKIIQDMEIDIDLEILSLHLEVYYLLTIQDYSLFGAACYNNFNPNDEVYLFYLWLDQQYFNDLHLLTSLISTTFYSITYFYSTTLT